MGEPCSTCAPTKRPKQGQCIDGRLCWWDSLGPKGDKPCPCPCHPVELAIEQLRTENEKLRAQLAAMTKERDELTREVVRLQGMFDHCKEHFDRESDDNEVLTAQVDRYREALEFYAYRDYPWKVLPDDTSAVWRDYGKRAREALKTVPAPSEE